MKQVFLNKTINSIKKYNPKFDSDEIDKIKYGLEGIYLTITKAIVLITISIMLGILKEFIIFTLLFNGIRIFAFGLHLSNSYICLVFSGLVFILASYFANIFTINPIIKLILLLICIGLIILYAPADTHKRPLIKRGKRRRFKFLAILISLVYGVLAFIIPDNFLSNCLVLALFVEVIMILPISYRVLKMPYNNYKAYVRAIYWGWFK